MNHLDDNSFFSRVASHALSMGFSHVGMGVKRLKPADLIAKLRRQFGAFGYRNFHIDMVNRVYGTAFVNQKWQKEVAKRGK